MLAFFWQSFCSENSIFRERERFLSADWMIWFESCLTTLRWILLFIWMILRTVSQNFNTLLMFKNIARVSINCCTFSRIIYLVVDSTIKNKLFWKIYNESRAHTHNLFSLLFLFRFTQQKLKQNIIEHVCWTIWLYFELMRFYLLKISRRLYDVLLEKRSMLSCRQHKL